MNRSIHMFCLAIVTGAVACAGPGDPGVETIDPIGADGQIAKADNGADCDALSERIEALHWRAERGDDSAYAMIEDYSERLRAMEADGACDAAPECPEPAAVALPDFGDAERNYFPEDPLLGCEFDLDGDGVLTFAEGREAERMPASVCRDAGGAVVCPAKQIAVDLVAPERRAVQTGTAGRPELPWWMPRGFLEQFMRWVRSLKIHERRYRADDYDCDDFADDLERAVERLGRDSGIAGLGTFTYIACNWDARVGNYTEAHAVTDVHIPGLPLFWIEPQTGKIRDLDADGDGKVEYVTDFATYPTPTEDARNDAQDCFIAVFDSAAAAERAGLSLD